MMRLGGSSLRRLFLARITMGGVALVSALFPATAMRAEDCGSGVTLTLSAPETTQGTLLLAEIRSATVLDEVTAKWNDRDVPFWRNSQKPTGSVADIRKGLLGVDLEKPAGVYEFTV